MKIGKDVLGGRVQPHQQTDETEQVRLSNTGIYFVKRRKDIWLSSAPYMWTLSTQERKDMVKRREWLGSFLQLYGEKVFPDIIDFVPKREGQTTMIFNIPTYLTIILEKLTDNNFQFLDKLIKSEIYPGDISLSKLHELMSLW